VDIHEQLHGHRDRSHRNRAARVGQNEHNSGGRKALDVYDGTIIVDIPGYGQETHVAADAAKNIDDDDVILSAHLYPVAYNNDQGRPLDVESLQYLHNNSGGFDCMVGEFGTRTDGNVNVTGLIEEAKSLGWPVIAWCWNGDGGDMNMITPYWGNGCTPKQLNKTDYFDIVYKQLGERTIYAQAENGQLENVSISLEGDDHWGTGYVTGFTNGSGLVIVTVTSSITAKRAVKLRYKAPYGEKYVDIKAEGEPIASGLLKQSSSFRTTPPLASFLFREGENTLAVGKGWGWYEIDCIIVV